MNAITEYSEAHYRAIHGWLTHGDGSPLVGVIYAAPDWTEHAESVATSTDGRGFFFYDTPEAAAEDTGASVLIYLSEDGWNRVLNAA